MSLKSQTVSGVKWLVGGSFLHKLISFTTTIIIARYLGPSVYGLVSFAMVIVASFELFKSLGVDSALLRRTDDFDRAANTAFLIIPSLGLFLFILLYISAPYIGKIMGNPDLIPVTRALGIIFVMTCFSKVSNIVLEREMQFKTVAIIEMIGSIIFSVVAIIGTFLDYKVWSLVLAYIIKSIFHFICVWIKANWRPAFQFDKKLAREMLSFGKFIFLGSVLVYFKSALDSLLVGKLLGITMLGFYAVAFNISNFSYEYFGIKVYRVTYPVYAKLAGSLDNLRGAYLKVTKYLSLIAIPLGLGVFLMGEDFLRVAYGNKWIGAIGVLKVLAWAGIFNTLPASASGIFMACGKPKESMKTTAVQVILFFLLITPFAKLYGLVGVGSVVVLASLLSCIYTFYLLNKILHISSISLFNSIKPALISSLLMTVVIIMMQILLSSILNLHIIYKFFIVLIIAGMTYTYSIYKLEKDIFKEIKEIVF